MDRPAAANVEASGGTFNETAPPVAAMQAKLDRLRDDYRRLAEWAAQQNAGNAFAEQVKWYALARLDEWDEPVERWEP